MFTKFFCAPHMKVQNEETAYFQNWDTNSGLWSNLSSVKNINIDQPMGNVWSWLLQGSRVCRSGFAVQRAILRTSLQWNLLIIRNGECLSEPCNNGSISLGKGSPQPLVLSSTFLTWRYTFLSKLIKSVNHEERVKET